MSSQETHLSSQQRRTALRALDRNRLMQLTERFELAVEAQRSTSARPLRAARPACAFLAATLGLLLSGCLLAIEEFECTPADTSYGCCLKKNVDNPAVCGAPEQASSAMSKMASQGQGSPTRGAVVGIGSTLAAATLSSDNDAPLREMLARVEEIMKRCAELADEQVNRQRLGGSPSEEQCRRVVRYDKYNKPVYLSMDLGEEKHVEALKCVKKELSPRYPDRFSIERYYRYDRATGQRQLADPKKDSLVGTLRPDVVIHSGDPLNVQAVYDFKFPCLKQNPARWRV